MYSKSCGSRLLRFKILLCSEQIYRKTIFTGSYFWNLFVSMETLTFRRPSQKSPIPLNRYDDFVDDLSQRSRSQDQTPEPRLVARALYNFVGQSSRELTFRRGDIIFIRRQVDKNWYEGEYNAMIGLFPSNYVEVKSLELPVIKFSRRHTDEIFPEKKKYHFLLRLWDGKLIKFKICKEEEIEFKWERSNFALADNSGSAGSEK